MKNAVIYLVNKNVNSLAEEERVFKEHAATIPGIKVTDVYLEETPEEREHLITKLYEKAKKGEVQIILTNSFVFVIGGERCIRLLADKIYELDIDVLVGSKLPFKNNEERTFLGIKGI